MTKTIGVDKFCRRLDELAAEQNAKYCGTVEDNAYLKVFYVGVSTSLQLVRQAVLESIEEPTPVHRRGHNGTYGEIYRPPQPGKSTIT